LPGLFASRFALLFVLDVLPDGPPARRATTSWWVYRSWRRQLLCPPVGRDLDGAQHSSRKAEERGDEFEGAANYDADEAEGKQDEPDERIEDQGCEGQGPAEEGEEAKEKEVEHRVCVS
jgi:hypothetical protein